jgi:CHAT domain-containing protein
MGRLNVASVLVAFVLLAISPGPGHAQTADLTAPSRTVADITAILDQQKPSPGAASKMRAEADQPPPTGGGAAALARFYYKRGEARSVLGRYADALADADSALAAGKGHLPPNEISLIRQLQGLQYTYMGDPGKALELFLTRAREAVQAGNKGPLFNTYHFISSILIHTGDLSQAETYVRKSQALLSEARTWSSFPLYGSNWQAEVSEATGVLAEAKGQFGEAEAAFRRAEIAKRETLRASAKWPVAPPRSQLEYNIDSMIAAQGRVKARQGRLAEAEADVRQALLNRLTAAGKYTSGTAKQANALADVLAEQGRYPEAEKLARTALDIYRTIGLAEDTQTIVVGLTQLANIINLEGNAREAARIFDQIDAATRAWEPKRREQLSTSVPRISTLYRTRRVEAGIAAAQTLVARNTVRFGADSFNTAYARGTLAVGLTLAGRDAEAIHEFTFAIPMLLAGSSEIDGDDAVGVVLRKHQIQATVERYMGLLVRTQVDTGVDSAAETFRLAEAIRSRSVQQALSASGARVVANDPAVADLVRKEQDSEKQVGARLGLLNNLLALPPEQRDDTAINDLRKQIETLQTNDSKAKQEIRRRFPKYADLIDPKPPAIDEIKSTLKPDEALVSFYFGSPSSFVWAVPKEGPVVFAAISASSGDIDAEIKKLREALEPNVSTISEIPPFDLALAHELYDLLLKPVQSGWKPAKSLIVVTNGALGMLPLGLLTTAPSPIGAAEPLFAAYRDAPWLARTHAVTMIPSTSSLLTLRRLPPGSPRRDKLIGFGDPYFNEQEAAEAEQQAPAETLQLASTSGAVTRSVPFRTRAVAHAADVDRTEFALLPRLPDTRLELIAMARALDADPAKALFLGRDANERNVETIDLSRFRIVAFATHGLVPGDLDGLTQPALALTAPQIAGVEGDGLLTMEKILPLKLDADWVVLSACNTAAGAEAGAEAASGLGRAFFYAGTRALLVTNWSVHSASARELITDLFRRQSADPHLARAEALRQAMLSMLDGRGFVDSSGKTLFTYAHPLFWAPYSVIGDGGGT